MHLLFLFACFAALVTQVTFWSAANADEPITLEGYIRAHVATREEVRVFLDEMSWAQFDPDVGYILGNYMPRDGLDDSSTLSTVRADGARTSFMYANKPCRINTYGNSFTQCHQVSDGETWQEYLAAHLGEPIRNYGMGGFGVYQSYRRMLREEQTENAAPYMILYIWGDDHIRSLFRCRFMALASWNRAQQTKEGVGRMFHGNFWSNIEMDLQSGEFREHPSRISKREDLYQMTDPYRTLKPMLEGKPRYDQEIADFLTENGHRVFDMNLVHLEDYKSFNLSVDAYFHRYFLGHYSPAGNHFFAYALKDHLVEWLDPKPLPYRDKSKGIIDFSGYLRGY